MGKKSKSKQFPKEWMYLFHSLSTQGIDPRSLLHPNSFGKLNDHGHQRTTTMDPAVTAARNLAVTVVLVEDDAMERTDPEPPRKQAKQRISKPSKKVLELAPNPRRNDRYLSLAMALRPFPAFVHPAPASAINVRTKTT
ncbi:hypothetical protein JB92DRAFT_2826739 [Gautieria morchelliformis]|nr:hypothetical protein JB92DRAFT_2826739 [Gautieria morchelliformis]